VDCLAEQFPQSTVTEVCVSLVKVVFRTPKTTDQGNGRHQAQELQQNNQEHDISNDNAAGHKLK